MGIIDKVGALLPWRRERREEPARSDVLALRDDFDRWFERFFEERWEPLAVDIDEGDDEVVIRMDVPGLDRDDLNLTITPQGLTVRGEKLEDKDGERHYESFVRTVPLPPGLDVDGAEARVRRGVLTVRFPKVVARPGSRRVPIRT